jgi:hypothetical protein
VRTRRNEPLSDLETRDEQLPARSATTGPVSTRSVSAAGLSAGIPADPYAPRASEISGKVIPPAIAMIVVAVINMLGCLYMVFSSLVSMNLSDEKYKENMMMFYTPEMKAEMQKNPPPIAQVRMISTVVGVGGFGLGGLLALLTVFGAVRMMSLKGYGLAVFSAIVTAIPCISCMACCGFGEGVGIWALVVLLNPDVRAAFR